MRAAEMSLQKNIETNVGAIFQNLFIDWEEVGEAAPRRNIHSHAHMPESTDVDGQVLDVTPEMVNNDKPQ